MAAANPCDSEVLFVSVVHGTFQYGIPISISYELSVQDITVRGEGVVSPSCRATVATDLVAVVNFLVKPARNHDEGPSDLVITTTMADGGARTHTLKNMVTRGQAYEFNRDNPPAIYRQTFVWQAGNVADPADDTVVVVG